MSAIELAALLLAMGVAADSPPPARHAVRELKVQHAASDGRTSRFSLTGLMVEPGANPQARFALLTSGTSCGADTLLVDGFEQAP